MSQNCETLTSVKIIHSKLSSDYVNAICDSLHMKGLRTHGIQIFSINTSSFLEANSFSIPVGLESFLSSARCVCFHTLLPISYTSSLDCLGGWQTHFLIGKVTCLVILIKFSWIDSGRKSLDVYLLRTNHKYWFRHLNLFLFSFKYN